MKQKSFLFLYWKKVFWTEKWNLFCSNEAEIWSWRD